MVAKEIWIYRLIDAKGDKCYTVVDDPSDSGCIGGYDVDGKYHQYDSYELYHAYEWAEERGMTLSCVNIEIDPESYFK